MSSRILEVEELCMKAPELQERCFVVFRAHLGLTSSGKERQRSDGWAECRFWPLASSYRFKGRRARLPHRLPSCEPS